MSSVLLGALVTALRTGTILRGSLSAATPRLAPSLALDFLSGTLDPRITFSRGTNATLVDSTGKITYAPNNQLLSSEDFDAAYWAKARGSITANVATAPNGTTTADLLTATSTGTYAAAFRSGFTFIGATQYIYSVYAKASVGQYLILYINETGDVGRAIFDLNSGAISSASVGTTASITPVGDGWWRCVVSATPSTTTLGIVVAGVVDSGAVTTVTSGKSILIWGAQLEPVTYQTTPGPYVATTASAYYGPRFDYDPVTLAPRGLLIEEARTNLLTYSQDWTNAAWSKTNITVTAAATRSPDGTTNAQKLEATAAVPTVINNVPVAVAATSATFSIYVKQGTGPNTANVFLLRNSTTATILVGGSLNYATGVWSYSTGTTGVTISNAGNGWWRVQISATSGITSGDALHGYVGWTGATAVAGEFIYAWGAQLEAGAFATSYIPTVASTVSRSADVATMTGTNFSSWFNTSAGTFVVDSDVLSVANPNDHNLISLFTSSTNLMRIWLWSGAPTIPRFSVLNVTTQAELASVAGVSANTVFKSAVAYNLNDFGASYNGATTLTDTSGTVPTGFTQLNIGSQTGSAGFMSGHIRAIAYYNTRLPNTSLQTLTAPSLAAPLALDFLSTTYTVGY